MSCQDCQKNLPGHLYDALSESDTARISTHLGECETCRAELEAVRGRMDLLRQWPDQDPAPDLATRTMARLAAGPAVLPWWKRISVSIDEALARFGAHSPTRLTGLATVALALALLVPVLSPNWQRGRSSGALSGCRVNLRLLGKMLDRYAADHQGRYPAKLEEMSPTYVRLFPECPHAGKNTYSQGYRPSQDQLHYTLSCQGDYHQDAGLPANEPQVRK